MLSNYRLTCQVVLTLGLLAMFCSARMARADYTATIDPTTQYQTFEGWGTSLAWFANVLGSAPANVRNNYADLLFDGNKGLGLNVVRYNIGGGENPAYHFLQFRAAVPGYEPSSGVYDWAQDANQRWFLRAAMARGANQLEAFSNSPPYWMTNSASVTGSTNGSSDNLNPAYYDAFADYLSTVAAHFAKWHILFRDVEPCNEPIASWWKFGGGQEGCHFDRSTQNTIVAKLGAALASEGPITSVAASDENSIDDAVLSLGALDGTALGYLAKVNTHSYNGSRRLGLWNNANSVGKALWMSEYGDGDASGLTMSEQILADMRQMHPTAWVYWQAVDDNSAPGWGMLHSSLNSPTDYSYGVNEKFYVMENYSHFIHPGYKFIFCDDGQSLAAYNQANGTLVIVTTNNTNSSTNVTYKLHSFNRIGGTVTPYRTSASESLVTLAPIQTANGGFSGVAAANSVTTYVMQGAVYTPPVSATIKDTAVGTGLNQFNYSGDWLDNDGRAGASHGSYHWGIHVRDAYTIRFSGTQILLYGSTGPDHGINALSIDGGPEEEQDFYSAKRSDSGHIYASATLPNGVHTLKVRVTGRKNPRAIGTAAYADRAEIVNDQTSLTMGAYEIINRNRGDVMDINESSTAAGTQAIQWPNYGGNSQLWQIAANGGYIDFVNVNSGLKLDVSGASTAGGADIIQWYSNGGLNQDWSLFYEGGLYYKIYNRNSGMVLNVNSASTSDGANLIQWYDNDAWNSQWAILRMR